MTRRRVEESAESPLLFRLQSTLTPFGGGQDSLISITKKKKGEKQQTETLQLRVHVRFGSQTFLSGLGGVAARCRQVMDDKGAQGEVKRGGFPSVNVGHLSVSDVERTDCCRDRGEGFIAAQ